MKIQLKSNKVLFLQFFPIDNDVEVSEIEIKNQDHFNFDLEVSFPTQKNHKLFTVTTQATLVRKDRYLLQIIFSSEFETNKTIDTKFKASKFPYINAPAIAYPFFRATIATILINSGWEPYYLPSVNFEKLYNEKNSSR